MQFRTVGNKIQIVEYAGYDKEKKRSTVKMVGSLDRYSPRITDELKSKLTAEQEKEIQQYIETETQRKQRETDSAYINICDSQIRKMADCITVAHTDSDNKEESDRRASERVIVKQKAEAIWEALEQIQKALKKAGHPRPKKEKTPPAKDPRQKSLV